MISDVQYTQYEFPILEIELNERTTDEQLALLDKNCFQVMPNLFMSNAVISFRTRGAVDRYIGHFPRPVEGVNCIAKLGDADFAYAYEQYSRELKAYSDVMVMTSADRLLTLSLPRGTHFTPMVQIGFPCDAAFEAELGTFLEQLQTVKPAKCILIEPDYRHEIDFRTYNLLIEAIYHLGPDRGMYFERGNFPVSAMREHPCNAYILSCSHCHSGKKDLPRMYTIYSDGRIFPEGMGSEYPEFLMGNIFEQPLDQLLDTYRLTPTHLQFKEACKRVYHDFVLDYPFAYIPWRYFYIMKANEMRSEVVAQ